jgi:hypothetical protein
LYSLITQIYDSGSLVGMKKATRNGLIKLLSYDTRALLIRSKPNFKRCIYKEKFCVCISGYWISHKAIKMCFDKEDSLVDTPYSTDLVWQLIKEHFSITDRYIFSHSCAHVRTLYSWAAHSFFAAPKINTENNRARACNLPKKPRVFCCKHASRVSV